MIRRLLVFNIRSDAAASDENNLESEFLELPNLVRGIERYSLGRNRHPMRPDLWMCTHVWETEFQSFQSMTSYANDQHYRALLLRHWGSGSDQLISRAATTAYNTSSNYINGDLLIPGRLRRLHLTNFSSSATSELRKKADDALLAMPNAVPQIKAWALGYNVAESVLGIPVFDHSWDTSFDSIFDLQKYVTCGYHINNTHDFVVPNSPDFIYEALHSCIYKVDPMFSGSN